MDEGFSVYAGRGLSPKNSAAEKYLTFWADCQLFGVPIFEVEQIIGIQRITEIPDYPSYAKGVINLRGTVIPVIDVRLRLGKTEAEYTDRTCVIVSNIRGCNFGFIVDGVDEVTNIYDDQVTCPPQVGSNASARYLTGVARICRSGVEKLALLLDTARILGENEFITLEKAAM